MSDKPKKYIFENGIMKQNPAYVAYMNALSPTDSPSQPPQQQSDVQPLAIVSSMADIAEASTLQMESSGVAMQVSDSTVSTFENMQESAFLNSFQSGGEIDGGNLLDELTEYFSRYEVPVGMIHKLFALRNYRLVFIVDDSGSMKCDTDVPMSEASPFLLDPAVPPPHPHSRMTRWQEAENRLHIIVDILAYVPVPSITVCFLNSKSTFQLHHQGKSVEEFRSDAHRTLRLTFSSVDVRYKTPTFTVLARELQAASSFAEPTMLYLLTDGVPTDRPVSAVAELIARRPHPERTPITLLSCSNEDDEVEWMKEVEEAAPYTAEIDDYVAEKAEVITDQGPAFPYTKGLWLISMLAASVNPVDLDALDENLPFSKQTLDELLGRKHTEEEYKYYFDRNPHAQLYADHFVDFVRRPVASRQIVSVEEQQRRERGAGYVNGKPTRQISHHMSGGSMGGSAPPHLPPPAYGAPPYSSPSGPPAYGQPPISYGQPPPPPSGAVGSRMGQVQVPQNAGPGSVLQVRSPDGTTMQITVPPGAGPGAMLRYTF